MASRLTVLAVFVIPTVASVAFAGAVMAQIVQDTRAVDGTDSRISIVGLEPSYPAPAAIEAFVHVTDAAFDCGELYVEIRDRGTSAVISHDGFFAQCFAQTNTMIPVGGAFTAAIAEPGEYDISATVRDAHGRDTARAAGVFTVG